MKKIVQYVKDLPWRKIGNGAMIAGGVVIAGAAITAVVGRPLKAGYKAFKSAYSQEWKAQKSDWEAQGKQTAAAKGKRGPKAKAKATA